jgi:hypothetical protein
VDTAFIIGNGESRLTYPLDILKEKGYIYGCNAIFRDNPELCDAIVTTNDKIEEEITQAQKTNKIKNVKIITLKEIPDWNFILPQDKEDFCPPNLDTYRFWVGGSIWLTSNRRRDFSLAKGSGCSAVLHAAEKNYKNIFIIGFDILGSNQKEIKTKDISRVQNNVYKNSPGYPHRDTMRPYLKHEWLYQLTQIFRKYQNQNFYYINSPEYIEKNPFLRKYFSLSDNIKAGTYSELKLYTENVDAIRWYTFKESKLVKD